MSLKTIVFTLLIPYCIISSCTATQKCLVSLTLQESSISPMGKEKFTLELPSGKLSPQKIQRVLEVFVMHPDALEEFLISYVSPKQASSETMTSSTKESSDLRRSIQTDNSLSTLDRYSSQNSLIELLGQHVVNFITTPSNTQIYTKIERIITKLLSDPAPNKQWILSLIAELKTHSETVEFYNKLNSLIMEKE